LQVKTQVAIAIADQHLLEKKRKENEDAGNDWRRKAEMAVDKKQDDLARAALERSITYDELAKSFAEQVGDQKAEVDNLKNALNKLEAKMAEANNKSDLLIAQHRRARALNKASDARAAMGDGSKAAVYDRLKRKVARDEAVAQAKTEMITDSIDDRFAAMEKDEAIDKLLAEIKNRRAAS
jgi:phage shock protein A